MYNYSAESCLIKDVDGKLYNIIDLWKGIKKPVKLTNIQYDYAPKGCLIKNIDGVNINIIDLILSVADGSLGESCVKEVIDARGEYTTLQERLNNIDSQCTKIENEIFKKSKNILDSKNLIKDKWFKNWGDISKSDYLYYNQGKVITTLIKVSEGDIYGATDNKAFVYIMFNNDGTLNKVMVEETVKTIVIPQGVTEMAFGFANIDNMPRGIIKLQSIEETPLFEEFGKVSIVAKKEELNIINDKIIEYSSKMKSNNFLDKNVWHINSHIKTWGDSDITNYLYENDGYYSTEPIDVREGQIFKSCMKNGKKPRHIGFITFNSDGIKVRVSDVLVETVVIQSGEDKIAFALGKQPTDAIMEVKTIDEIPLYEEYGAVDKFIKIPKTNLRPCDYTGDEITMLGKGVIIGDSFVQGGYDYKIDSSTTGYFSDSILNFPANLSRMTGLDILNKGDGGQTATTWWERHKNDDLSDQRFAFIALGINDTYKQVDGWNNSSDEHIRKIVEKLRTQNGENIKIFIATIPNEWSYNDDFNITNERIRDIATELKIFLVDLAKYNNFSFGLDILGGHPTSYGYYNIAKHWKSYISYIIALNNKQFTRLQFIGTDYSY